MDKVLFFEILLAWTKFWVTIVILESHVVFVVGAMLIGFWLYFVGFIAWDFLLLEFFLDHLVEFAAEVGFGRILSVGLIEGH